MMVIVTDFPEPGLPGEKGCVRIWSPCGREVNKNIQS